MFHCILDISEYHHPDPLPDPFVQHRIEGDVERHKVAMLQTRLGRKNAIPGIAMLPVEGGR